MMVQLSEEQTKQVVEYLDTTNVRQSLKDDLLDQLCCEMEALMDKGLMFSSAFEQVAASWPQSKIQSIDRSIKFTTKTKPMITRVISFSALLIGFFLLSPPHNTPKDVQLDLPTISIDPSVDLTTLGSAMISFDPPKASPLKDVKLSDAHSTFGMRVHPIMNKKTFHRGLDFVAPLGTPVLATAAGKVIASGTDGKYGIRIIIQHADGYSTLYAHLSTADVKEGDVVSQGAQIGKVGSTGASVSPHLHYEVRKENKPVNPLA